MDAYLEIVKRVLKKGVRKENRTGVDTLTIFGEKFEHDMADGFPLLTTKKVKYENVSSELEFFMKGLTDKRWLHERKNPIWNEWCNPQKVPYGQDPETKRKMAEECDLGPIYGFQWRHFGAEYKGLDADYTGQGVDQLATLVKTIKTNPHDRRMIVSAWNPVQLDQMGLPPCHYSFQVDIFDRKLHLAWNQRSVDVMLGLPFNIASYATLLHLLAKETGYKEGTLVGNLSDTQIYVNHAKGAEEQASRKPYPLPSLKTENFSSIFDWQYTNTKVIDYQHHPFIKFPIAV
ncbi:MAG: thymidylate synthase [Nanoarchaeota archaeon]|nr:thymidylate synthase [Nanoarchaeota archaeon]